MAVFAVLFCGRQGCGHPAAVDAQAAYVLEMTGLSWSYCAAAAGMMPAMQARSSRKPHLVRYSGRRTVNDAEPFAQAHARGCRSGSAQRADDVSGYDRPSQAVGGTRPALRCADHRRARATDARLYGPARLSRDGRGARAAGPADGARAKSRARRVAAPARQGTDRAVDTIQQDSDRAGATGTQVCTARRAGGGGRGAVARHTHSFRRRFAQRAPGLPAAAGAPGLCGRDRGAP